MEKVAPVSALWSHLSRGRVCMRGTPWELFLHIMKVATVEERCMYIVKILTRVLPVLPHFCPKVPNFNINITLLRGMRHFGALLVLLDETLHGDTGSNVDTRYFN